MSFSWTSPQPLIETTGLAVFFSEIQNAVDTLRQLIGQPTYTWDTIDIGTTIQEAHYVQLKQVIDPLIQDYSYSSVIDILGHDWSLYAVKYGQNIASYQLLQDFRDVLDALRLGLEQFIITTDYYPFNFYTTVIAGFDYRVKTITGDLGDWILKYIPTFGSRTGSTSFTPADENSIITVTGTGTYTEQITIQSPTSRTALNSAFVQGFEFELANIDNVILTENDMFKLELIANYSRAYVSMSPKPLPPFHEISAYPILRIEVQFLNNAKIFRMFIFLAPTTSWAFLVQLYTGFGGGRTKVYTIEYADVNQEFDIYTDIKNLPDFDENKVTYLKNIYIEQFHISISKFASFNPDDEIIMLGEAPNYEIGFNKIGIIHT